MIELAKIHWHGNRVTGNRRVRLRSDDNAAQSGAAVSGDGVAVPIRFLSAADGCRP